jgi:ankyrin repeat protein
LIWSDRELDIDELVDAIAINLDEDPAFVPKNRMPVPRDVLKLCSSLVAVYRYEDEDYSKERVRLAHFSVKEYLVSDRVSDALKPLVNEKAARSYLARLCLRYLVDASRLPVPDHVLASREIGDIAEMFPFLWYSADTWMIHYRKVQYEDESLFNMALSSLQDEHTAMVCSFKLWEAARGYNHRQFRYQDALSPLNHAARGGLDRVVERLLDRGAKIQADNSAVLHAALEICQDTTLKLLVRRGLDVNAGESEALLTSVYFCRYGQIQLLLDNGADFNARGGEPLREAIRQGDGYSMHLLLEKGADVNAGDGGILIEAVRQGQEAFVRLLIGKGAVVNAEDSESTALQVAIDSGYKELVELLFRLEERGNRTTALKSASFQRWHKIIQLLIETVAATDVSDELWVDTLRPGVWSVEIVQEILESGAYLSLNQLLSAVFDRDPQAEAITSVMLPYVTPDTVTEVNHTDQTTLLHYAALGGSEVVVQKCLDLDVDIHAEDFEGRTALHYAAHFGHLSIVKILVQAGSDLDALDEIRTEPFDRLGDDHYCVGNLSISGRWRGTTCPDEIFAYLSDGKLVQEWNQKLEYSIELEPCRQKFQKFQFPRTRISEG